MTRLRYRAITRAGAREAGFVDAATEEAASAALRDRGLVVLEVSHGSNAFQLFHARARRADLVELTRALASLLAAGLTLVRAIDVARGIAPASLQPALRDVQQQLERGISFADALATHPVIFPPAYVGLVRAGERAGALADSLARLADVLDEQEQFRARLVTAAIYPMLLATVGGAAVIVLLVVVLPRFASLFASSGSALPASTAAVLALSHTMQANATLLGVLALAVAAGLAWLISAPEAARWRTATLLALPGTSKMYREVLAARAARLLAMLLTGGAPIVMALDDAARSLDAPQARDELLRIRARVREGTRVTDALAEGTLFPEMLTRLVAVGEESSQLAGFFARAADLFEGRARRLAARFVAMAEPAVIVVFGLVVGVIALALVQAIYGINLTPLRAVR